RVGLAAGWGREAAARRQVELQQAQRRLGAARHALGVGAAGRELAWRERAVHINVAVLGHAGQCRGAALFTHRSSAATRPRARSRTTWSDASVRYARSASRR